MQTILQVAQDVAQRLPAAAAGAADHIADEILTLIEQGSVTALHPQFNTKARAGSPVDATWLLDSRSRDLALVALGLPVDQTCKASFPLAWLLSPPPAVDQGELDRRGLVTLNEYIDTAPQVRTWSEAQRATLREQIIAAMLDGTLATVHPQTYLRVKAETITPLIAARLLRTDLDAWMGVTKHVGKPGAVVATTGRERPPSDTAWVDRARVRAKEILADFRGRGLHPNQIEVADQIAREFRSAMPPVFGPSGKPLTGAYIKRHALGGISSAQSKQLSTAIHRGK